MKCLQQFAELLIWVRIRLSVVRRRVSAGLAIGQRLSAQTLRSVVLLERRGKLFLPPDYEPGGYEDVGMRAHFSPPETFLSGQPGPQNTSPSRGGECSVRRPFSCRPASWEAVSSINGMPRQREVRRKK